MRLLKRREEVIAWWLALPVLLGLPSILDDRADQSTGLRSRDISDVKVPWVVIPLLRFLVDRVQGVIRVMEGIDFRKLEVFLEVPLVTRVHIVLITILL